MTEGTRQKTTQSQPEAGMLENNIYNIIEQLNIENKSLWRIKANYKTDDQSSNCPSCKEYWYKLEKQKQENIKELTELLREQQWQPS